MRAFFEIIDPLLLLCFWIHDTVSEFLARHLRTVKTAILLVAHLALFGLLFPELRKDAGNLAAIVLIGILFLSPLSKICRMRLMVQLMGLRRELGILMGYLATVHVAGYFIDSIWFDRFITPYLGGNFFSMNPTYLFGIVAYTLTLPLLFTSNTLALRALGGWRWKNVHRLAYPLLIFTMLHRFTIRGMTVMALLQAILLIAVYGLVKLQAQKNILPTIQGIIDTIGARYTVWKTHQVKVVQ
jgi:sulfoxide reductase heme-binding subunit YedZ